MIGYGKDGNNCNLTVTQVIQTHEPWFTGKQYCMHQLYKDLNGFLGFI